MLENVWYFVHLWGKQEKNAEFYAKVNNVKPNQWKWAVYAFWQLRSQKKTIFSVTEMLWTTAPKITKTLIDI